MTYKLLNTTGKNLAAGARKILKKYCAIDDIETDQKLLLKKISDYEILFVQLGLHINRAVMARGAKLKIIASPTTGLDHIDLAYAAKRGIKILSLRGETEFLSTITGTAELAFGLMIDLMRLNPFAFDAVKNYEWDKVKFKGHNLYGQTLGIVGLGRLGKWLARYGNAFNMRVIACDPLVSDDVFKKFNATKVDFDTLVKNSDVISLHVHLSPATEKMFNKQVFAKMKPSAYLINTARGKIVDEQDLLMALKNKMIAGYAADGLAGEVEFASGFSNYPLVEYAKKNNNCIIVPHTGGMTYESREATDIFIANKIVNYLKNK
ncbi:MAG: NAD(P)-dependent oxidoreductase [Patescibacteria group bacterium]|nr:NAD(P)-dependent oxidoreductase [Patescibacteria group bacterium]